MRGDLIQIGEVERHVGADRKPDPVRGQRDFADKIENRGAAASLPSMQWSTVISRTSKCSRFSRVHRRCPSDIRYRSPVAIWRPPFAGLETHEADLQRCRAPPQAAAVMGAMTANQCRTIVSLRKPHASATSIGNNTSHASWQHAAEAKVAVTSRIGRFRFPKAAHPKAVQGRWSSRSRRPGLSNNRIHTRSSACWASSSAKFECGPGRARFPLSAPSFSVPAP